MESHAPVDSRGPRVNSLAWTAAIVATFWLATYCFNTLAVEALGLACIGLVLAELGLLTLAIKTDLEDLFG